MFLTQYASNMIQRHTGKLPRVAIVPHGISQHFFDILPERTLTERNEPFQIVYVSNAAPYKHQWTVIEAVALARQRQQTDFRLVLVGGGTGESQARLEMAAKRFDPRGEFVKQLPFVPNSELPSILAGTSIFLFASSCENMPVTLLEGMAAGLPIACSDRGPMPETMGDAGIYFDPEEPDQIADAICYLAANPAMAREYAVKAKARAGHFTPERCAASTWQVLAQAAKSKY
jgi:glycosyltransferase involved in cell wall biosynthesis